MKTNGYTRFNMNIFVKPKCYSVSDIEQVFSFSVILKRSIIMNEVILLGNIKFGN